MVFCVLISEVECFFLGGGVFYTVGPVRASALNGPGRAKSLGPVAPSPKSCYDSTVRPEALLLFTKTRPLHASQPHLFTNKVIRNKSLELTLERSQNERD